MKTLKINTIMLKCLRFSSDSHSYIYIYIQGVREVTVHPQNTHLRLKINFKLN